MLGGSGDADSSQECNSLDRSKKESNLRQTEMRRGMIISSGEYFLGQEMNRGTGEKTRLPPAHRKRFGVLHFLGKRKESPLEGGYRPID